MERTLSREDEDVRVCPSEDSQADALTGGNLYGTGSNSKCHCSTGEDISDNHARWNSHDPSSKLIGFQSQSVANQEPKQKLEWQEIKITQLYVGEVIRQEAECREPVRPDWPVARGRMWPISIPPLSFVKRKELSKRLSAFCVCCCM